MAEEEESVTETPQLVISPSDPSSSSLSSLSRNVSFSRLNAQAPEFVPTPRLLVPPPPPPPLHHHLLYSPPPPHPHHHHPHHHQVVHYRSHHQYPPQEVEQPEHTPSSKTKPLSDEQPHHKILKQVEYYFSDLNLATTDHLMRFINKDPEGFVPISVVASFKKIKALITSHSQLANVLRNSSKLVVSEDGKKIKRQYSPTESDIEELQSRIVIAENLPEDHCHQNLMKVFSAVGSVKTIRTCPPQTSNNGTSSASRSGKVDGIPLHNKLHAFVEYESVELAERAVTELNDEGNWRSGLRVRLMLRRTSKPPGRGRKGLDVEVSCEEDYTSVPEPQTNEKELEDASFPDAQLHEHAGEEHGYEKESGQRKGGRGRGRTKGRGRVHCHQNNNRVNHHLGTSPSNSSFFTDQQVVAAKQPPPGPRMPDGTRGFSMGRGKPVAVNIA